MMTRLLVRPTRGHEVGKLRTGAWYKHSYRRHLLDMHIEDWDERFLSKYDPKNHVKMLKQAKVESAMVYANSHVGHCYWPTKSGHVHRGLGGRDALGEIVELCHKEGIDVIVYYSLIYNNWAYEREPEWRIIGVDGRASREGPRGRYGVCCPSARGYREFVLAQIEELCQAYEFEGLFFDMTFWPDVCYCSSCRNRFKLEAGEDLPVTIDWMGSSWLKFQRKREEWLLEFAGMATAAAKRLKPDVSVEHQYSTVAAPWRCGVTDGLADHCDYIGGDFYGGLLQQSFVCKLYYNLTPEMPFEFMTSICYPGLAEHTTTKSAELIANHAFLTIAHGGAVLLVDAVDPIGTLDERRYRTIGDVFGRVSGYEEFLGGELCQDVGVYFSFDSKMSFAESGNKVSREIRREGGWPHVDAALGTVEALRTAHIPFGVVTRRDLGDLSRHQVLVLPNVLRLSDEEADAIIEYVRNGGTVYASKFSARSRLADILGISPLEETKERVTYVVPTTLGAARFPGITSKHPLDVPDAQLKATCASPDGVLAVMALPYTDPGDGSRFAAIHSNPPGVFTDYPAMIYREFGQGAIIWSAAAFEVRAVQSVLHRSVLAHVIRSLARRPLHFEAQAPACVEIVEFHRPEEKRYVLGICNFQSDIGEPNIPVSGATASVRVEGVPKRVLLLPDQSPLEFGRDGEYVTVALPVLETFLMLAVDYER